MQYLHFEAIAEILRCAYCGEKMTSGVKFIPICGNSICGRCNESLVVLKSNEFECHACSQWHKMPVNGFDDNLAILRLLAIRPEERAFPERAQQLQARIDEARRRLAEVAKISRVDEVNVYCDKLREEIAETVERRVAQLRKLGDDHLSDLEAFRSELVNELSDQASARPSKRRRLSSSGENSSNSFSEMSSSIAQSEEMENSCDQIQSSIEADLDRFSADWSEYFNRLSRVASDAEIEQAHEEVNNFGLRILDLEHRIKTDAFGGRFIAWKANNSFLFLRNQLGELVYESPDSSELSNDESLPPLPVVESQSPSGVLHHEPSPLMLEDKERPNSSVSKRPSINNNRGAKENIEIPKTMSKRHVQTVNTYSKYVFDTVFLPGDGLAFSCSDRTIKVWSSNKGGESKHVDIKVTGTNATALAVLAHGWLAAGCQDGSIRIWDVAKREPVRTLKGHTGKVFSLKVLRDGNLASVSWDNTIKIWNPFADDHVQLVSMVGHDNKWIEPELGLLSDDHLVTCSSDPSFKVPCVVKVWNPFDGVLAKSVQTKYKGVSAMLVLANDTLALGFTSGEVRLFDLHKQTVIKTLKTRLLGRVNSIVQLADGHLAGSGLLENGERTLISIVDLERDANVEIMQTGHQKRIRKLKLSQDGRLLASTSFDNRIKLWSMS